MMRAATTLRGPRFNNTGTQLTVLHLQSPGVETVARTILFWDAAGAQVANSPLTPRLR